MMTYQDQFAILMTKDNISMKMRSIISFFALLVFLTVAVGAGIYYLSLKETLHNDIVGDANNDVKDFAKRIAISLSENQKISAAVAGLKELPAALMIKNPGTLQQTNAILDHFQSTLQADVCYLIDHNGDTIASSNRNTPQSFVDKNYTFRPYFQDAISGIPAIYPALGVVTKKRGLFYSYPVYGGDRKQPLGVLVIKGSTDPIERELYSGHGGILMLVDPHGIVFVSNQPEWLYQSLWRIPGDELSNIVASQQFGAGPIEWLGIEKNNAHYVIDRKGEKYIIQQKEIANLPGWKAIYLLNTGILSQEISVRFFRKFGPFLVVFCFVIGLAGLFLYRKADREIRRRMLSDDDQKQSFSLLQATLESTADGILVVNGTGEIISYNAHFAEMWRLPDDILSSRDDQGALAFVSNQLKDPQEFLAKVVTLYAHPAEESFDVLELKDNRIFERYSRPQRIQNRIVGRVWSFQDVTYRKQAEIALRKSEGMLQAIIEAEPECVKLLDKEGCLIMMNEAGLAMIEADSLEQVKGQSVSNLVTSEYRQLFKQLNERVFRGESGVLEFEVVGIKGTRRWLETHAVPFRNEKQEIIALLGVTRDITERKRMEEALRQNEEFLRNTLDSVDEGFLVIDRDFRIQLANKAYANWVGMEIIDIIGSKCHEITHKVFTPCFETGVVCAVKMTFDTGMPHRTVHQHTDKDGNWIYIETRTFPAKDSFGNVTSVIEVLSDITEKHLLEEERMKTQKLESIGTLAGGIAHDFNNLLQGVFGYIAAARLRMANPEVALSLLEQAEEALQLSVNLTAQLLTFSKGGKPVKKLIRIRPAVENAMKFALSGSHSNYKMDIADELWSIEADEGQLAQVIQNIVLNANQAMAGSGTVHVSLANEDIAKDTILGLPDGGRFVRICIQDTGTGISEQNISKIFDPYFTTKQKGSGLGLATSYSIIRNHGGVIEVKSEINSGTTFTIYLPASRDVEVAAATTASAAVGTKKGRVLLMDDEEMIRNVAREMIEALGHDVVSAEDGKKAIELYRQAREDNRPFDLVILDLTVKGGMGGEEAIKIIREIDPNVKAVVSSGYAGSSIVANYREYGFLAILNKPYRIDALKDCLNLLVS